MIPSAEVFGDKQVAFLVSACLAGFASARWLLPVPCAGPRLGAVESLAPGGSVSQPLGPVLHHHRGAGLGLGRRALLLIGFIMPVPFGVLEGYHRPGARCCRLQGAPLLIVVITC